MPDWTEKRLEQEWHEDKIALSPQDNNVGALQRIYTA